MEDAEPMVTTDSELDGFARRVKQIAGVETRLCGAASTPANGVSSYFRAALPKVACWFL
jgi:hypothetical protein